MNMVIFDSSIKLTLAIVIIIGLLAARRSIGVNWIVITITAFLIVFAIRRVDEIASQFGYMLLDDSLNSVLTWLFLAAPIYGFWQMWQRRRELRRMESLRREQQTRFRQREAELEALRAQHGGVSWDQPVVRLP